MKRSSTKKGTDRRKHSRGSQTPQKAPHKAKKARSSLHRAPRVDGGTEPDACYQCSKKLSGENERALFVEEEVGRIFCSEACIAAYFTPEIERLEKEYFRQLTPSDLSAEERESLAHLRWITLQEPDEVWREKTLSGDYRYTLIAEFKPGAKKIWSICICLFLRGEPSFLYLAMTTRNSALVNHYRRGEPVEWVRAGSPRGRNIPEEGTVQGGAAGPGAADGENGAAVDDSRSDRLADEWTEDETFLAQMSQERRADDIPAHEFGLYQSCVDETLEAPDEVWSSQPGGEDEPKVYHFIRHYPEETPGLWYLIIARETEEDGEQIEILDAFPTRDAGLVDHYRKGHQEVGASEARSGARVVH